MLWLILGLIAGLVLAYVISGSRAGKIQVLWYQWVLAAAAVALMLLTIQNYLALLDELEPAAAALTWVVFGLPAVILAALIWVIPWTVPAVARLGAGRGAKAPAEKP